MWEELQCRLKGVGPFTASEPRQFACGELCRLYVEMLTKESARGRPSRHLRKMLSGLSCKPVGGWMAGLLRTRLRGNTYRPRRTLRLRGVPGSGFRLTARLPRPSERRGATFGEFRTRPLPLSRMPALGLKGGVGRVTLPTLRPCLPR